MYNSLIVYRLIPSSTFPLHFVNMSLPRNNPEVHPPYWGILSLNGLQKFTMNNIPGCNELFVTSEQRFCMNEIAKADKNLLDKTVHLTKVFAHLPEDNNEDEEWEYSFSQNGESSSLASSIIGNPWITDEDTRFRPLG
ncbi:hypothetical protein RirG_112190 [Rhizophagus irregularis DAOM 197198w]|uniref:Uncharacterized protein n=2 Tax=Rhizophagus irregularis TaxID=588596 RepID=A0A015JKJ4_RHIIW|nr:hypothetical protein RirG_112190 [Rhizophagus irregularis DAOM 197198w]